MYQIILSGRYTKHLHRMTQHKKFDIKKLEEVVNMLAKNEMLPAQYRDHELKGKFKGIRECHVQNDVLLLYTKHEDVLVLLLVDIGTHSSLFNG